MLDVGWTELLLIGVVALIVIGPKDLPVMFHTLGRILSRARGMAREFSSAMEDAARASGVQEATKELRDLQKLTSTKSMGLDALGRAADKFEKWDPLQPVREGKEGKSAIPDPSAPKPPKPEAKADPAPAASAPGGEEKVVAPAAPPATGAPSAEAPQPGARRLHAVRRTDRS
ncbi:MULTISPECIES: Sec-independent protein translocase protein TatB [unclassified Paracoccus (in: a-proteobacteria)]|uniref:Sec-independent protein translocase protein TatB n=1 Tax=unclassified Paracoccus (in: a-proteobacteria) TaxID=2688777 RepID=UPI001600D492|nr:MULTISPECIES: Sec-independent protein translocase protein TatB [unclassified Paracoccus (in: a-proteobacteria)]MBB1490432.1 twin-arginine translocase subunit TatB [Paracoccus sp. MC1854]MBB1497275.1 twin-arginine translocase subunit TatB [Paracoccus sp. MC1862]QQO44758.1 twin-arginine translocase subunit TatB [Paracoccus sp. MC1862]